MAMAFGTHSRCSVSVVGQALNLGLKAYNGATTRWDPELKRSVEELVELAETQANLAPSERQHVQAVKLLADGSVWKAGKS